MCACLYVLVSQGLFLLLLALGGAVCDVVEARPDPRQMKQRPGRLLHFLIIALRFLQRGRRTPLLQRQRVANGPRFVFGPGQTAPSQRPASTTTTAASPGARDTATSLSAQGLLGYEGSARDMGIQRDLAGLCFDVRFNLNSDDVVVVVQGGGRGLGGVKPGGGFGRAVGVVVLEVLAAGGRSVAQWAVLSSAQIISQGGSARTQHRKQMRLTVGA